MVEGRIVSVIPARWRDESDIIHYDNPEAEVSPEEVKTIERMRAQYEEDTEGSFKPKRAKEMGDEIAKYMEGEVDPNFICQVCAGVILDPVECKNCQYIICAPCARGY